MSQNKEKIRKKIMNLAKQYYDVVFANQDFIPGKTTIPPSGKLFDAEELQNGLESILDGWWTEGRFTKKFEEEFSKYLGVEHTLLANSGSSASLLALAALTSKELGERRIMPGDEVISVAAAFPTTVNPIVQMGAVPVFLDLKDISSGQYNIDCTKLKKALSQKTKAIFVAHTLGNPVNLEKITDFAKENNLWFVEDCCDALGSKYKDKKLGIFGDISTFSFYPAHHITMGEGGAVATNNSSLNKLLKSFRNWGRDCWCGPGEDNTCKMRFKHKFEGLPEGYDHKNIYSHLGYNLKATDMQASIGLAQLKKIDSFIQKRKENFEYFYNHLKKYEQYIILPKSLPEAEPSWFGFLLSVKENAPFNKKEINDYLEENKVSTRTLFTGNITKQPYFKDINYRIVGDLKNTDLAMHNTFWIGIQPNITKEKREYVTKVFDSFFDSLKK